MGISVIGSQQERVWSDGRRSPRTRSTPSARCRWPLSGSSPSPTPHSRCTWERRGGRSAYCSTASHLSPGNLTETESKANCAGTEKRSEASHHLDRTVPHSARRRSGLGARSCQELSGCSVEAARNITSWFCFLWELGRIVSSHVFKRQERQK